MPAAAVGASDKRFLLGAGRRLGECTVAAGRISVLDALVAAAGRSDNRGGAGRFEQTGAAIVDQAGTIQPDRRDIGIEPNGPSPRPTWTEGATNRSRR
ncbi:hypothetical protein STHU_07910 [Allostella humosa]|nr:hypothetical protein STHU_07910 [Stella humosa]